MTTGLGDSEAAPPLWAGRLERTAKLIMLAVCLGIGIAMLIFASREQLADMDAYWQAGERLRAGGDLYVSGHPSRESFFVYAPWFAWLWIPLTWLPRDLVALFWFAVLLASSLAVIVDLLRRGGWAGLALAGLLGSQLIWATAAGNVQPLLVAALYFGLHGRAGPLIVATAASLKAAPIAFVCLFAGRREWRKALVTLGLTAILVAPALAYDLTSYPADPELSLSLLGWSPPLYILTAGAAIVAALILAPSRYGALASAIAVIAVLPRLLLYHYSFLLVGAARPSALTSSRSSIRK